MGLNDHHVVLDKFEFDEEKFAFFFPCCACKHRMGTDYEDPCRTCGHNTRCVRDEVPPNAALTGSDGSAATGRSG